MFTNFIPTVWSADIQRQLERLAVGAKNCNRDYEGIFKEAGDTVKILSVGRPTISNYVKGGTLTPESMTGADQELKIEVAKSFCYEVDDIDQAQAKGNIMDALATESSEALADVLDSYIFGKYAEASSSIDCSSVTSVTILSKIAAAKQALYTNNVSASTELCLEVSPAMMTKITLAKILYGTPNDGAIVNGYQGMILGCKVYMANGIYNDGSFDWCLLRTKRAITLAEQISKTEAYRPQDTFSDAVKGLHVYGAKVVRPKEMVSLKFSAGAETTI